MTKPKVLVGRLFHESNGYNPVTTKRANFDILTESEILGRQQSSSTTMAGIIHTLNSLPVDVIPVHAAAAPPSGRVVHSFFLEIVSTWLDAIERFDPDAIAIELHGAMATTETNDADGDFLALMREVAKPDCVIGVGLDLHAHITPKMLSSTDICIACKENPHSDVYECGMDVARLVMDVLEGRLQPVMTLTKTRMLLPGKNGTADAPLSEMHQYARKLVATHTSIIDITLYNAFRFLDAEDIGQAAVVLTNGLSKDAAPISVEFANSFWNNRDRFHDDLTTVVDVLDRVAENRTEENRPFVLADMGDRVLAGAPGDGNTILETLLADPRPFKAALTVTDPLAIETIVAAGIGAEVTANIGGAFTPSFDPIQVTGRVTNITDGEYTMRGPYQGGEASSMGISAVLVVNNRIYILINSKPAFTHDPNAFESQGIEIQPLDLVVVKSGYHFELNFEGIATPVLVASPGLSLYTAGGMKRVLCEVWPDHDVSDRWLIPPITFDHRRNVGSDGTEATFS